MPAGQRARPFRAGYDSRPCAGPAPCRRGRRACFPTRRSRHRPLDAASRLAVTQTMMRYAPSRAREGSVPHACQGPRTATASSGPTKGMDAHAGTHARAHARASVRTPGRAPHASVRSRRAVRRRGMSRCRMQPRLGCVATCATPHTRAERHSERRPLRRTEWPVARRAARLSSAAALRVLCAQGGHRVATNNSPALVAASHSYAAALRCPMSPAHMPGTCRRVPRVPSSGLWRSEPHGGSQYGTQRSAPVPVPMWVGPVTDVGTVPAQMWGQPPALAAAWGGPSTGGTKGVESTP